MRTLLDGITKRWSLDSVVYDGRLVVRLADWTAIVPPPPTLTTNGYEVRGKQDVVRPRKPRLFEVIFERVIAYQAIEEPCIWDPDFLLEEGQERGEIVQVLARSRFLGSVHHHPFFEGPRKAYQIYTEDMIVEVIALCAPEVRMVEDELSSPAAPEDEARQL